MENNKYCEMFDLHMRNKSNGAIHEYAVQVTKPNENVIWEVGKPAPVFLVRVPTEHLETVVNFINMLEGK